MKELTEEEQKLADAHPNGCWLKDAPPEATLDKNGIWRNRGRLIKGQSLNISGMNETRRLFKETCQRYSIDGLDKIYELFWNDDTKEETVVKIQEYFTKYGFGLAPSAPEDLDKDKGLADVLPTIVRIANESRKDDV